MGEDMMNFSPDDSLSLFQLSLFRTELCKLKAGTSYCSLGERCQFSHCLSWHRRNPFLFPYRPLLCPNTRFWTESKRMKVKTWCRRGRHCMFAHTKEEQMYHPLVYKTQVCRDWPGCNKPFCPFAHGLVELRDPDSFPLASLEGPEIVEEPIRELVGEDKIRQDFERKLRERENGDRTLHSLKRDIKSKLESLEVFLFVFRPDSTMVMGSLSSDVMSTEELFEESVLAARNIPRWYEGGIVEIVSDTLVAIPLVAAAVGESESPSSLGSTAAQGGHDGLTEDSRSARDSNGDTESNSSSLAAVGSPIDAAGIPRLDCLLQDQLLSFISQD